MKVFSYRDTFEILSFYKLKLKRTSKNQFVYKFSIFIIK